MGLLKVVNCVIQNHHAGREECLGTRQMQEFTSAKIIWLSIYRRSFGCHIITYLSLPLSTPWETKVKCHFLASMGACNMIFTSMYCCVQLTAVKRAYLLTNTALLNSKWISLQRLQVYCLK